MSDDNLLAYVQPEQMTPEQREQIIGEDMASLTNNMQKNHSRISDRIASFRERMAKETPRRAEFVAQMRKDNELLQQRREVLANMTGRQVTGPEYFFDTTRYHCEVVMDEQKDNVTNNNLTKDGNIFSRFVDRLRNQYA